MTVDEAIVLLEHLLQTEEEFVELNDLQVLMFRMSWMGCSYREIADRSGYHYDYIKQVGSHLWQSLSRAIGQTVSKRNLQISMHRYRKQRIA